MMKHSPADKSYQKHGEPFNNNLSPLMLMQKNVQMKLLAEKERKLSQLYQAQKMNSMKHVAENSSRQVQEYFNTESKRRTNPKNMGSRTRDATWSGNSDRRVLLPPLKHRKANHQEQQESVFRNKENSFSNFPLQNGNKTYTKSSSTVALPKQINNDPQDPFIDNTVPNTDYDSPPDMTNLKLARNKKILEKKKQALQALNNFKPAKPNATVVEMPEKMTDFQRWQMEQDQEKHRRLENYWSKNGSDAAYQSQIIEEQQPFYMQPRKINRNSTQPREEKSEIEDSGGSKWRRRNPFRKAQKFAEKNYAERPDDKQKVNGVEHKTLSSKEVPRTQSYSEKTNSSAKAGFTKAVLVRHNSSTSTPERYQNSRTNSRTSTNYSASPSIQPIKSNISEIKYQVSMDMQQVPQPNEYEQEDVVLAPCSICGRKFKQDRLSKHKEVCMKSTNKKRKVFDMSKARKQGTDLENYRTKRKTKEPPKRNNWKLKHEDFIQTVRHAKSLSKYEAMGGNIADLPPPPPSLNPDYIQCQYCERRFAPQAAERHIPKCKDMKARPTPLRRKPTRRI